MPARPARHPMATRSVRAATTTDPNRIRARTRTDANPTSPPDDPAPVPVADDPRPRTAAVPDPRAEDGSVATEYGLLAVVAATIVSVMLNWATSGGITSLLDSVLARVGDLVGL